MQLFSRQFDRRVVCLLIASVFAAVLCLGGLYYHTFRSPVYAPVQPVEFSHETHAGVLGMDCRACHTGAESSARAGIPDAESCMNCHRMIKRDSPKIEPLLRAADPGYPGYTGEPIRWTRVNRIAGHANFNHQAHVTRGIGCTTCHGDVATMKNVSIEQNRGMRWCMECHRDPTPSLRPLSHIADTDYSPEAYIEKEAPRDGRGNPIRTPEELGKWLKHHQNINPKTDCTACHQ